MKSFATSGNPCVVVPMCGEYIVHKMRCLVFQQGYKSLTLEMAMLYYASCACAALICFVDSLVLP